MKIYNIFVISCIMIVCNISLCSEELAFKATLLGLEPGSAFVSLYKQKPSDDIPVISISMPGKSYEKYKFFHDYIITIKRDENALLYTQDLRKYFIDSQEMSKPSVISTQQIHIESDDLSKIVTYAKTSYYTEEIIDKNITKGITEKSTHYRTVSLYKLLCLYSPISMLDDLLQPFSAEDQATIKNDRLKVHSIKGHKIPIQPKWSFQNLVSPYLLILISVRMNRYWQSFKSKFAGSYPWKTGIGLAGLAGLGYTAWYTYKKPDAVHAFVHRMLQKARQQ